MFRTLLTILFNADGLNLNNTTFNSNARFMVDLTGSTVSGVDNIAVPFSCNNGGSNTDFILFNGGVDQCP